MGAAVFAYASKIFAARPEQELKLFAESLAKRANMAWAWADANPDVLYYNNDESKQPGSKGLAAGQQEMSAPERVRAKVEAATYLFEMTGEARFKAFVDANYNSSVPAWGPTQWDADAQEALLYYARLPGASADVSSTILKRFLAGMAPHSAALGSLEPYRSPMKDYTWGSNKAKAMQARLFQLLAVHSTEPSLSEKSLAAALEYAHYIHGVNPLGLVYLTNMASAGASHSATTMFHAWFAYGTRWQRVTEYLPGPAPGFLVGGPNPQFAADSCCRAPASSPAYRCHGASTFSLCQRDLSPPLAQPPLKSYLQFNDPWPANSWEITEPSLNYQSYYIRLLAAFTR